VPTIDGMLGYLDRVAWVSSMRREEKKRIVKEKARERYSFCRLLSRKYLFLLEQQDAARIPSFSGRTRVLRRRVGSLLRKKMGSATSAREVPAISKRLFGLIEDAKRLKVEGIDFDAEIGVLNDVLTAVLSKRLASRYDGECGYGEALLNAYIDIFITATLPKTSREFEAKPTFLIYPVTGSILELDVMLEDFRLAFEFQGEHHYTNPKVRAKDALSPSTWSSCRVASLQT
jgi:hypothetical protein